MRLYHFVPEKYGISNLEHRRLKLARIEDLNDPFEINPVCIDAKARKVIADLKRQAHAKIGLLCFSARRDNPVQWSHYADGHKGMCLGFEIPRTHVTKVNYVHIRPAVDIHNLFANESAGHAEMNRWLNVKFDHWQYEHEWRAAFELDPNAQSEDGNYYADFDCNLRLAEVMVGVRSKLTRLDVNNILGDIAGQVKINKGRLSFRATYRVVIQQSRKIW
jgi:hypothetical protein